MLVGIDLGTTNSLVACFRNGEPELIPNRLGGFMTPSVVSVDEDGTLLVGETAKEYGILGPYFIKGDIAGAIAFMKDIPELKKAEKYYHDLFGLETLVDNDGNMILSDGLVLQEEKYWRGFIGKDVVPQNNACELYFEEENLDAFYEKLKTLYSETEFVNQPMTHSWGQCVVRFYDPDGNLIEVGTPVQ